MTKFVAGICPNRNGRPKGSGYRQQIFNTLVMPHQEKLVGRALEFALAGNENLLRVFLDRLLPAKPRDEPIEIDNIPSSDFSSEEMLAQLGIATMKAVTAGKITPEEASRIATLVKVNQSSFQLIELQKTFSELKQKFDEDKNS